MDESMTHRRRRHAGSAVGIAGRSPDTVPAVRSATTVPNDLIDSPLASQTTRRVVVAGLAVVLVTGFWALIYSAPGGVNPLGVGLSTLLLGSVLSIPAVVLVVYLDRRDREPWWLAVTVYLWGAVVATSFALIASTFAARSIVEVFDQSAVLVDTSRLGLVIVDRASLYDWLETAFTAPFVEEAIKAAAVLLLFALVPSVVNSIRDGVVYGAIIGIGFLIVETAWFVMVGFEETGSAAYLAQMVPRFVFFGVNGHVIYTALFGAVAGMAIQSTTYGPVRRALGIVAGFLLAVAAHSMSNAFGPFIAVAFASVLSIELDAVAVWQLWWLSAVRIVMTYAWAYVILVYLVIRSGYWELDVCRIELADEVPDTVTPEEYALVEDESLWRRRRIPWLPRRRSAAVVVAQNRLAFHRDYLRRKDRDPAVDEVAARLRAVVRGLANRDGD
jgi:RsiW-degrading membrane proteinase PrsW (M82 family)